MDVQGMWHLQFRDEESVPEVRREGRDSGRVQGFGAHVFIFRTQGHPSNGEDGRGHTGTYPGQKGVGKGKSAWGKGDGYPKEADGHPMGNTEGQNRGDPWKTKEERRDLIAKYLKLQANARETGLDEDAVVDIQLKIDKLNKQVEKEPPPGHLLESTRLFLERAKKRLAKAEEELTELQEAMATKQELLGELQSQVQEA